MTSFNNIINTNDLNDVLNDENSSELKNETTNNLTNDSKSAEILFSFDDNIPKEKLVHNEIHYLDSSKIYNTKKQLGKYTLKLHQNTTLYYMIGLEKMLYNVERIKTNNNKDYTNHYTNVGILSDQVGAGKSYCIMALINENKSIINKNVSFRNKNIGSSDITPNKSNILDTNVLLVPHSLIGQWSQYLENSGLKYYVIQKSKDVFGIADKKCKFKQDTKNDIEDTTEITENPELETKTKPKPKKKLVLKKKTKLQVNESEVKAEVEASVEPTVEQTIINKKLSKPDSKKKLETDKRQILREIANINNEINILKYNPNYSHMNISERELINDKIAELKLIISDLNLKYEELNYLIKKFDLDHGNISSLQLNSLNDYNTIYNNINHKSYNPELIEKELKEFLDNLGNINKKYVESFDLILVSDTFYNLFSLYMTKDNYTVNRIIIDECNSIKGSQLLKINTLFTWLVTSSVSSLMTSSGYTNKPHTSQNGYVYNVREKTIMSTGFILSTICILYENKDNNNLYLINDPDYIKQSISLPQIQTFIIICKDNVVIQVLNGIVSNNIMKMLNAGDIEGIITKMDVIVGDENNIITIITQKYNDELLIKEYELKVAIENPKYNPEIESASIINKRESITTLKYKIECIKDRIKNTDNCPICIDDFINPIITPCCNNKYCFNCITNCLNCKSQCPSCRNNLTISKILVLSDKIKNKKTIVKDEKTIFFEKITDISNYKDKATYFVEKSLYFNKYENLDNIFNLNKDNSVKKYLIFTEYESTLNVKITSVLDKWNLKYDRIRGSSATINKQLEKYKNVNGETNVLLVNSKFFGSGMNLENTSDIIIMHKMNSDIEMQAIGRAQRFGRVGELRVWKLYYQNEMTYF